MRLLFFLHVDHDYALNPVTFISGQMLYLYCLFYVGPFFVLYRVEQMDNRVGRFIIRN